MASPMVSALKKLDQALDPSDTPKRLHPAGLCATPTQRPCRAKSREVHFTGLHFIPIPPLNLCLFSKQISHYRTFFMRKQLLFS